MGGGNLLFIIMFTLPFVAIAGIIMLARNWSTPVDHPEPSGWEAASKERKKGTDPLFGPSSAGKKTGPGPATATGASSPAGSSTGAPNGRAGKNGTSAVGGANGELRARPAIPPQAPAYLDDGDGWLPMDDPANADTGPNPRHRLN